ncbi:hypothetical protein Ctha_0691 [Chloroherpeton thalassium ATCC 35110]|uniref:Uncharacterized protein n=1 Tax=Chloroherpeton thalassium (strain ATCC 35110 / GB-78) TaxID=517418 RepID=B3QVV3_CHLT3|nr:COR domain-containing protein [Chloroherpeton thalassium]ACF13160.1 hypothetical protein Ctha_0691 [Chloroherpeton thalassium ATCC 35110]
MEELLIRLHALGVSLWYKEMEEFKTLVLNPEWISHGVYQIINWVRNEKGGHRVALSEFRSAFQINAKRYPEDKHAFLFKLMKHYELAYESEDGGELVIPHLLKEDRPAALPYFPVGESLMLRYQAEQPLPPDTISRFIVRHNKEIRNDKSDSVWRYGVILQDGKGSLALVREKDHAISVEVKGTHRTDYLSRLRETLNAIFQSYKSDKPELQYRIEPSDKRPEALETKKPLLLSDRKILSHYRNQRPYWDDITGQEIPMQPVIINYNITIETFIQGGQGHQIVKNTFNFHNCNITLQGHLNELAGLLAENGKKEEAKELENAANALDQPKESNSPEELKKKGVFNKVKRLIHDLQDDKSDLNKTVKGVRNGVKIVKDLIDAYNSFAPFFA